MRRKWPWNIRLRGGPYSRGWVGFPTMLVATGWVAIWLLWPTSRPSARPGRIASRTRIEHSPLPRAWRHAGPPSVFVGPWVARSPSESEDAIQALSAFEPRADRPVMLEREPAPIVMPAPLAAAGVLRSPAKRLAPLPETRTVFTAPPPDRPAVTCRASTALDHWGFAVPAAALADVNRAAGSGTVALQVALDDSGRPESVFVEESSGDKRFDAIAVQAVYRGHAERQPNPPAAGRVVIVKKGTP